MRIVSAGGGHWETAALDVYRAIVTIGSAEWRNGEMLATSSGTDPNGKSYIARSKYFDITGNSFRFQQDRSSDNGKSWSEGILKIDAKRVAGSAPR